MPRRQGLGSGAERHAVPNKGCLGTEVDLTAMFLRPQHYSGSRGAGLFIRLVHRSTLSRTARPEEFPGAQRIAAALRRHWERHFQSVQPVVPEPPLHDEPSSRVGLKDRLRLGRSIRTQVETGAAVVKAVYEGMAPAITEASRIQGLPGTRHQQATTLHFPKRERLVLGHRRRLCREPRARSVGACNGTFRWHRGSRTARGDAAYFSQSGRPTCQPMEWSGVRVTSRL